jgi:hypothetical protein
MKWKKTWPKTTRAAANAAGYKQPRKEKARQAPGLSVSLLFPCG